MFNWGKLCLKYSKVKIEKEILEEELVELKEKTKEMLYQEVIINPGKTLKLKEELNHKRQIIKELKLKLKEKKRRNKK